MILQKYAIVNINRSNFKHFQKLGYSDLKYRQPLKVKIEHLLPTSKVEVKVQCNICKIEKNIQFKNYKSPYLCKKCAYIKVKKTKKEKYGDENYVNYQKALETKKNKYGEHFEYITEKIKKTTKLKYNVDNIFQLDDIKIKSKKTKKEKYGDENYNNRYKIKLTKEDRYGDENYNNVDKRIKTNLEKYGVKYSSQNDIVKKKSKRTFFEKYGGFTLSSKELKQKHIDTMIEKYGVENYFNSSEFINDKNNKIIETNKKYNFISISGKTYNIKCDLNKPHNFEIDSHLFYNRKILNSTICTKCNPINISFSSGMQLQLNSFLDNIKIKYLINNRNIINGELDVYINKPKFAIEFNGLYWHSDIFKSKNYHQKKALQCINKNIKIFHIYEDNWIYKQDIVKSMILNRLNLTPNKIYARKTEIKEITNNKLVREFLENNHIQGFIGSKVKLGLFYEDELVSLMTFGKKRIFMNQKNDNNYELLRFCNKINTNVIGSASKLLKYFIDNYKPKQIITYASLNYSDGSFYEFLGFNFSNITKPNYFWFNSNKRLHRFNFRKDKLVEEGYDIDKTEDQIMKERNYNKIYDAGSFKYILDL